MTNWEYLEALANNSPDELQAWFDSEHVETPNATLHGDTAALEREIANANAEREYYREVLGRMLDLVDEMRYVAVNVHSRDEGLA